MKKLSKLVALGVAAALACGALAGCANSSSSSESTSNNQAATTTAATDEVATDTVFVTPEWLNSALAGEVEGYENVVVAEAVYDTPAAAETYDKGHVPGAILTRIVEVEDAAGTKAEPYNLLDAEAMKDFALKRGITKDTKLVLYGSDICGVSRAAYGYIYLGVEDVKVLNGGLDAWKAAGFETEKTENKPVAATDFGCDVPAHPEYWVSMKDARDRLANDDNFKLVSIRSEGEWLGETSGYSYIERAGEPEGAVWGKGCDSASDVNGFMNEDGTVKDLAGFQEVWKDCDFTLDNHLSFYCGTGWRATVPFLVLYQNGYKNISVYDGGWYEWQMYGDNPVQVGDPASDSCQHVTVADLSTDKAEKE